MDYNTVRNIVFKKLYAHNIEIQEDFEYICTLDTPRCDVYTLQLPDTKVMHIFVSVHEDYFSSFIAPKDVTTQELRIHLLQDYAAFSAEECKHCAVLN